MKRFNYKTISWGLLFFLGIAILPSCKDELLPAADRLFRPILSDDKIEAGLSSDTVPFIKVTWDKYADANEYFVRAIASDGSDSVSITTDSSSCTFKNMKFDKEYNIKIRSRNTLSGLESRDFIISTTTPDFPTRLFSISSSNIIDTQVRVMWLPVLNGIATVYDTIKVYNVLKDSMEVEVAVNTTDSISGIKIIRKLTPSTAYRIEAYKNGKYQGKKLFKTTAAESYSGIVIDLRGLTESESYKYFSTVTGSLYPNTVDSIVKANVNQDITFVLQGGVTYRLPTLSIPSTTGKINFVTGLSLNGLASFAVSGNVTTEANNIVGEINFSKIFFTDAPIESKKRTDSNYGGTYIFNTASTASNYEIGKISFSNCAIKYKRGVIRMQTAAKIKELVIDNCIIDSIGGYGITNADNAGSSLAAVSIMNSTFSNCDKLFVNSKPTTLPVSSFKVENSTFVYYGTNKGYMFDFNGCTVTNGIQLTKCIFGRPGTRPVGVLLDGVYGWRGLSSPVCTDCYNTSDLKWVVGADLITPVNPLSTTSLTTDTPSSFHAPDLSDFTVISSDLKRLKVGDPRWY